MKIIDRYVLREHLGPLLFALTALTSLLLLNYIAKQFGKLVGKGLEWTVIGEFFLLSLPFTVAMTLPMAVLVSTLYAFSRLASEAELTAFKASGVSMRRLLTPVVIASVFVAAFMVYFNDQVLPRSNARLSTLQSDIIRTKPTFGLDEKVTTRVGEGQLWLYADRIDQTVGLMRGVVIYDLSQPSRPRTTYADSGSLRMSPNGSDVLLRLYDGFQQEFPRENPAQLQRTFFSTHQAVVRDVANQLERSEGDAPRTDRERTVCELQQAYNEQAVQYVAAHAEARELLTAAQAEGSEVPLRPRQTTYSQSGLGALYCRAMAALGVGGAQAAVRSAAAVDSAARAVALGETGESGDAAAESLAVAQLGAGPSDGPLGGLPQFDTPGNDLPGSSAPVPAGATGPERKPRVIPPSAGGAEMIYELATNRAETSWRQMNQFDVEIHKKFALAAACIVFVLLGAPVALRFPRGGVGVVIGVSLAVFGLYYVGLIAGETLADDGYLPPYIAMWGANILFTLVAAALLTRMGREGATSRGGDFGEMLDALRRRLGAAGRRVGLPVGRDEQQVAS